MTQLLKKISSFLHTVVDPPGLNLTDRWRRRLFVVFLIPIIVPLIIFGFLHHQKGDYHYEILNYLAALIFTIFIVILRYSKTGKALYRASLILLIIILGYWVKSGTGSGYASLWVLSFPPFAFFLMGKKEGSFWSVLLAGITISLFFNNFPVLNAYSYSGDFILRHLFALFLIFCFTYSYEAIRQQFQNAMETQQRKLLLEKELLEKSKNEMDEINAKLKEEADVRKRAEEELRNHREKLEELVDQRTWELLKSNKELELKEESYRILSDNVIDLIWATDPFLHFTYVSPSVKRILGYSVEEAMFLKLDQIYTSKSRQTILSSYRKQMKLFQKGMVDEQPISLELEQVKKDGTIIEVELRSSLARDGEGNPIGFVGITRDISDRMKIQREKEKIREQLVQAQKMEAVGQVAGGVAHDLNNVLGALSGYSELLLMEMEGHKSRGHVEKILQSTAKGAVIIQDLLTLTRRGVASSEVINLNHLVDVFCKTPVFENIKNHHRNVIFSVQCQESLQNVKGSPIHLEKTLMNLVANAAESISGTGEVTIRTENRYLDEAVRGYEEVREGDYVVLIVSDTGTGIPDEHKDKIFEPFYTRKKMGRSGTGLGLAIVWGTVNDHQGYVDVQTKVGEGTTFTLYFPVTQEGLIVPRQKAPLKEYMGHGESVLVVDDVAEQREVAADLLKKLGYQVYAVSSGEAALDYLRENRADILVLDMIMAPGMDGMDTYRKVLELYPQQRAILVSGYAETDRVRKAQKLGAGAYVSKPYVMEKIGVAIRDELRR